MASIANCHVMKECLEFFFVFSACVVYCPNAPLGGAALCRSGILDQAESSKNIIYVNVFGKDCCQKQNNILSRL